MQFRLRSLFIITTVAAVLAWAFYAPPQWLGLLAIYLIYFLLPAASAAGVIFHRGYRQAFFIGMAPWVALVSYWAIQQSPWFPDPGVFEQTIFVTDPNQVMYAKMALAIPLVIAVASGLVAVGIRWWAVTAEKRSQ